MFKDFVAKQGRVVQRPFKNTITSASNDTDQICVTITLNYKNFRAGLKYYLKSFEKILFKKQHMKKRKNKYIQNIEFP